MLETATSQDLKSACYLKGSRSILTLASVSGQKSAYLKLAELTSEKIRLKREHQVWERRQERIQARLDEIEDQIEFLLKKIDTLEATA